MVTWSDLKLIQQCEMYTTLNSEVTLSFHNLLVVVATSFSMSHNPFTVIIRLGQSLFFCLIYFDGLRYLISSEKMNKARKNNLHEKYYICVIRV